MITPSAIGILTAGQTYSLNCSLNGTSDAVIYQWFKGPAASNGIQLTNNSRVQVSSLKASDAGLYTCRAMVPVENMGFEETANVTISRTCFNT